MKENLKRSVMYTVYLFGSSLAGLLLSLAGITIGRLAARSEGGATIVSLIFYDVTMLIVLFILLYQSGYSSNKKYESVSNIDSGISCIFACLIYIAIHFILRYYLPSGLNIVYLAEIVINDYAIGIVDIVKEHSGIMLVSMLIQVIICIPPMILGFSFGNKKRKRERESLISHNK